MGHTKFTLLSRDSTRFRAAFSAVFVNALGFGDEIPHGFPQGGVDDDTHIAVMDGLGIDSEAEGYGVRVVPVRSIDVDGKLSAFRLQFDFGRYDPDTALWNSSGAFATRTFSFPLFVSAALPLRCLQSQLFVGHLDQIAEVRIGLLC
jgi:hypothetical protein